MEKKDVLEIKAAATGLASFIIETELGKSISTFADASQLPPQRLVCVEEV